MVSVGSLLTTVAAVARLDLVGMAEIAERLGVTHGQVRVWRHRKQLPDPEWDLRNGPLWRWSVIRKWAVETGRLKGEA